MIEIIPNPKDAIIKPKELWVNFKDSVKYEFPKTKSAPAPTRLREIETVTILNS